MSCAYYVIFRCSWPWCCSLFVSLPHRSSRLLRAFFIPFLSEQYTTYSRYVILKPRRPKHARKRVQGWPAVPAIFPSSQSKSSCSASSFGPKVFLLNSFCAHTCVIVFVCEWMNEYARVCLTILAIKPCSIGLFVDFSVAAHPGQSQHRAWMPYPSFLIISSSFHVPLFLLGLLCIFLKLFRRLLFRQPFKDYSPLFVMTSSLIWDNELYMNWTLMQTQTRSDVSSSIHPSRAELPVWRTGPGKPSASQDESCTKNSLGFLQFRRR